MYNTNLNHIRFRDMLSNLHLHHSEHHHQDVLQDKMHELKQNLEQEKLIKNIFYQYRFKPFPSN